MSRRVLPVYTRCYYSQKKYGFELIIILNRAIESAELCKRLFPADPFRPYHAMLLRTPDHAKSNSDASSSSRKEAHLGPLTLLTGVVQMLRHLHDCRHMIVA